MACICQPLLQFKRDDVLHSMLEQNHSSGGDDISERRLTCLDSFLNRDQHMPTPRKSCLRCHADKARCSYISRYQGCIRCIQKKIACELPVGSRRFAQAAEEDNDELTASSSYTHRSHSQTAALTSRIDKVEKLLADLKGSLPVSSSTVHSCLKSRPHSNGRPLEQAQSKRMLAPSTGRWPGSIV
jgi:hypothetical protein